MFWPQIVALWPFICLVKANYDLFSFSSASKRSTLLLRQDSCIPADPVDNLTDTLNNLLSTSGPNFVLNLCPSTVYPITSPLVFAAPNQEITTLGHPTDDTRATLLVNGSTSSDGSGHTSAIVGQCVECSGCTVSYIQVNGNRGGNPPITGGANLEMGGPTTGQTIEFVKTFDTRSWSCLHASEGQLNCSSVTIQNNDVGPCGSDLFSQWADGISVACPNSIVRNNMINTPTDGGIVVFGSPGTLVENNTIWVETNTLLGGINLVDFTPWGGNYTGTVIQNNTIIGGFATSDDLPGDTRGTNNETAFIKIGIAMGPRVWFSQNAYANISFGGVVRNNVFTGGFGFAMAANSINNFTVEDNILVGNTSFFGAQGPNCTAGEAPITPDPFVYVPVNVTQSSLQSDFAIVADGDGLVCIEPVDGDYWPFRGSGNPNSAPSTSSTPSSTSSPSSSTNGTSSSTTSNDSSIKVGLGVGLTLGLLLAAIVTYLIRKRALSNISSHAPTSHEKRFSRL